MLKIENTKTKQMVSPLLLLLSLSLLCLIGISQATQYREREYECVDIYKQPSLQHPLLKNHQIQMRPSDKVLAMLSTSDNLSSNETIAEFDIDEGCPKGKIPIHIPKQSNYTNKHFHLMGYGAVGLHAAIIEKTDDAMWHGASAWMGVYQPQVIKDQYSMALIWINTEYNGYNYNGYTHNIRFGWAVHPELYGDNRSRFTAYWGADDEPEIGCYNVQCAGFVQVHRRIFLGAAFTHISVIGGQQYTVGLAATQDRKTGNWLLTIGKQYIGYWPKEIVPNLAAGANGTRYGGFTKAAAENVPTQDLVSPPMGNGNKPLKEEGLEALKHSCYMKVVRYVTSDYRNVDVNDYMVAEDADAPPNCYDSTFLHFFGDQNRQTFTFGGPGGYCDQ